MSEMNFPKFQYSSFVGNGGQIVVRADTLEDFQAAMKSFVEGSGELAGASTALQNTFGVAEVPTNKSVGHDYPTGGTQTKTYARSVKPGPKSNESSDVPSCACGLLMSDVRGKTYQKGPKAGQPYPKSFYPSRDCTNNCDAR